MDEWREHGTGPFNEFIMNSFDLYQYPGFFNLLNRLPEFPEFVSKLNYELEHSNHASNATRDVYGFRDGNWFFADVWDGIGWCLQKIAGAKERVLQTKKPKFHNFINTLNEQIEEQHRAHTAQNYPNSRNKDLAQVNHFFKTEEHKAEFKHTLQEFKKDFSLFEKINSTKSEVNELLNIGNRFLKKAKDAFHSEQWDTSVRYKKRLRTIKECFLNNFNISKKNYGIYDGASPQYKNQICQDLNIDPIAYSELLGNDLQHCLHEELVGSLNGALILSSGLSQSIPIKSITHNILLAVESGRNNNLKGEYETASLYSDFAYSLERIASSFMEFAHKGYDLTASMMHDLKQGAQEGTEKFLLEWNKTIDALENDPFDVLKKYSTQISSAAKTLCKGVLYTLSHPIDAAHNTYDSLEKITECVAHELQEDPHNALVQSTAFVTQFFLDAVATKGLGKVATPIFNALKNEAVVLAKATAQAEQFKKIGGPLLNLSNGAQETFNLLKNETSKTTHKILNFVQKHDLKIQGDSLPLAIKGLALKKKMPKINWNHILWGEKKKNNIKGFHSLIKKPSININITDAPNSHGVFGGSWDYIIKNKDGVKIHKQKYSTFFPQRVDQNKKNIKRKIKEAYKNPLVNTIEKNGFVGETKEGIKIQFWFKESKKNQGIYINSCYPLYEQI